MFETNDVDIYWSQWKDLFLGEVQKCVPVKVIQDKNSPPWIDGEVRHIMRKKYRALKKYRDNRTEERKRKHRSLSNDQSLEGVRTPPPPTAPPKSTIVINM